MHVYQWPCEITRAAMLPNPTPKVKKGFLQPTTRVWHGFIDDTAADYRIPYVGPLRSSGEPISRLRGRSASMHSQLSQQFTILPREDQEKVVGGNKE
jgi:hypothetical protein